MNRIVLDASAALAVFFGEAGGEVVEPVLFGATMSAVNYSEVLKKAIEKGGDHVIAQGFLERQAINIVPFDAAHAVSAAVLLPHTAPLGLSFADRACVSLGMKLGYAILTAEKRMSEVPVKVSVKLIRKKK
ncbi:MAG: type II toxin-antitoxin system VapC family toxin [Planctomycetaceae bacterium]